jgi:hypothetical protein
MVVKLPRLSACVLVSTTVFSTVLRRGAELRSGKARFQPHDQSRFSFSSSLFILVDGGLV